MKRFLLIFTLLACLVSAGTAYAQGSEPCNRFDGIMDRAKRLWTERQFEQAFAKLAAAREACPNRAQEVDEQYTAFIRDITNQYERAAQKTREAEQAKELAQKNEMIADSARDAAHRTELRTYANDLASKSQIALRDGDLTTAYRLAEFAHRYVDSTNLQVNRAIVGALYYNDNPSHPPLPWALNLEGFTNSISSIAFSLDGRHLATGSRDGKTRVWDWKNGNEVFSFDGHPSRISSFAFSPDERWLAIGHADGALKLWDLKSERDTLVFMNNNVSVTSLAFWNDSKRLAIGYRDGTAIVLDLETSVHVHRLTESASSARSVIFSSNGRQLAVGSRDGTVKIWDLESGRNIYTLKKGENNTSLRCIAFSPDGKRVATGLSDNTAEIWDLEGERPTPTLDGQKGSVNIRESASPAPARVILTLKDHKGGINSLAFSPDGKQLATGSDDNTAIIWNLEKGEPTLVLKNHTAGISSVAFSSDGKWLATGSADLTVKMWKLDGDKSAFTLKHTDWVMGVAYSPNGEILASGLNNGTALIWNLEGGMPLDTLEGHEAGVNCVAFSPDGKQLATGSADNTTILWDWKNGTQLDTLKGHEARVNCIAFSPDGKQLATGSDDNTVILWDLKSDKQPVTLKGHEAGVNCIAFSPDGKKLATGSADNTVIMWDLKSGKQLDTLKGHEAGVNCVAFSPDGKQVVTGSADNTAKIWDSESGKQIFTLKGHTDWVRSISFSPDGKRLATGSDDATVKIWDRESGKQIFTLKGHTDWVRSISFSPDGKRLATGSDDTTVKIWEITATGCQRLGENIKGMARLTSSQLFNYDLEDLLDKQPGNEDRLLASRNVGQIVAFAELFVQLTSNNQLEQNARHYARAARLYTEAAKMSEESSIVIGLSELYMNWAKDILKSDRPDTAGYYMQLACSLGIAEEECKELNKQYRLKIWNLDQLVASDTVEELHYYGDYFFEQKKWAEAQQLYEKAQSKKHNPWVLMNLAEIAEKLGEGFDFSRFMASEDSKDLRNYGDYFFRKEKWAEAQKLYEKAQSKEHEPRVLVRLFAIAEKTGADFDFERFLKSEDGEELGLYAQLFMEIPVLLGEEVQILYVERALRIRERQMAIDTASDLRIQVAFEYFILGYNQLLIPDGKSAEDSYRRCLELDPANIYAPLILAPALLLQDKNPAAEIEFNKWKNEPYQEDRTYRDDYLEILEMLEKAAVPGVDFGLVRSWLQKE